MKLIKFDLPINGTKVKTLDELRDNLTDEIVPLARSGQLIRFLKSRKEDEVVHGLERALSSLGSDKDLFAAICEALGVSVCPEDIDALFELPKPGGCSLEEITYRKRYDDLVLSSGRTIKALESELAQLKNANKSFNSERRGYEEQLSSLRRKVSPLEIEIAQLKNPKPQISSNENPNIASQTAQPDRFGLVPIRLPGIPGQKSVIKRWGVVMGSSVKAGDVLCHTDNYILTSPSNGKVWALHRHVGATVQAGECLVTIEM